MWMCLQSGHLTVRSCGVEMCGAHQSPCAVGKLPTIQKRATTASSCMALATTSRPHQASPLAAPQMDAQFDVRNVLHSVDSTSSLLCSWRSKAAARKLRWRQQTHTLRMCPHEELLPKPQFTRRRSHVCRSILVTLWAVSSVIAHGRLIIGFVLRGLDPMAIGAKAPLRCKTPTLKCDPPPSNSLSMIAVHAHRPDTTTELAHFMHFDAFRDKTLKWTPGRLGRSHWNVQEVLDEIAAQVRRVVPVVCDSSIT